MRQRPSIWFLFAIFMFCGAAADCYAQSGDELKITYDKPIKSMERILGSAWWIYLTGSIEGNSASTHYR
jgi:hypothetical protein